MELAPQCNRYFTFHQEDASAAFLFIASILLIAAIQFAFDVFLKRSRFSEKQISFMRKIFIIFIALTFIISMEYLALYTSKKIINSEKTQRYEMDMKLFYRIQSNSKKRRYKNFTFSTDSNSIRSTYEIPFSKEKDEFRILHLGDSWTFGFGLNDDQTYSYLLEKKLQERYPNKKIVSINAGCIGYSLPQSFLLLEHRGFKYNPDIIVFKNNLNFMGLESFRNMNMYSNINSIVKRIRSILWKSNLYLYLRRINLIRLHSKSLGKTTTDKEHKEPNKYSNNLEEYELKLFNDIVEMTRSRGKKLIYLNLGVENNFLMSNSMNKAASNGNVPLVKVACDLSIDADFYKYYKGHPGPSNAKIIADSLFEYIVGIEAIEEK